MECLLIIMSNKKRLTISQACATQTLFQASNQNPIDFEMKELEVQQC